MSLNKIVTRDSIAHHGEGMYESQSTYPWAVQQPRARGSVKAGGKLPLEAISRAWQRRNLVRLTNLPLEKRTERIGNEGMTGPLLVCPVGVSSRMGPYFLYPKLPRGPIPAKARQDMVNRPSLSPPIAGLTKELSQLQWQRGDVKNGDKVSDIVGKTWSPSRKPSPRNFLRKPLFLGTNHTSKGLHRPYYTECDCNTYPGFRSSVYSRKSLRCIWAAPCVRHYICFSS